MRENKDVKKRKQQKREEICMEYNRYGQPSVDESFYRSILSRIVENDSHYMLAVDSEGFHVVYDPYYASFEGLKYSEPERTVKHYRSAYEAVMDLKRNILEDMKDLGIFEEGYKGEIVWSFYLNREELESIFNSAYINNFVEEDYKDCMRSSGNMERDR